MGLLWALVRRCERREKEMKDTKTYYSVGVSGIRSLFQGHSPGGTTGMGVMLNTIILQGKGCDQSQLNLSQKSQ